MFVLVLCDAEVSVPGCPDGFDEGGALGGGVLESTDAVVLGLEHCFY